MNAAREAARAGKPFPIPPEVAMDDHRTVLHVKLHVAVSQIMRDPHIPATVLRWRTRHAGTVALAILNDARRVMDRFVLVSIGAADDASTV